MTKIVSNLENNRSFLMKFIEMEFYGCLEIELLERSIRLVMLWFKSYTNNTGLAELLYISIETRLRISEVNEFQCFVLTKVASKNIIMSILENMCVEITSRWYIDSVIKIKKIIRVSRPLAICGDVFCSDWVTRKD